MVFNSLQFALFFPIVYLLYLLLRHRWQNRMLLVASCIFYGAWDWRFLALMFVSITTDFFCAQGIFRSSDTYVRKLFLVINFIVSLGILGFFKYFNFFAANLENLLSIGGMHLHHSVLKIILPVGISFYTFQAMSYVFDVYRNKLVPVTSYRDYALFVTYFPHLVAGPIMKARDLLPQVLNPRVVSWEKFYGGCYLIGWGLFQKMFVADNLAKIVDPVFAGHLPYHGTMVLVAVYAFAFQIYCDFAGYSNMARGLGRLMGFEIMINFNNPYFSRNPREFWQRWHISLSTWLKDYLYIPCGGSQGGRLATYWNIFITMLIGGLWHGANWTYVFWGAYHGVLLILHRIFQPLGQVLARVVGRMGDRVLQMISALIMFHCVCLGWLFFRASSFQQAWDMLYALGWNIVPTIREARPYFLWLAFLIFVLGIVEIAQRWSNDQDIVRRWPLVFRFWLYVVVLYLWLIWGQYGGHEFIYFQF
ncbi:MAG: MBOAT family protein [Candidatus Omnitrophica bacterium]|nr:MBOAT family protein [Candidatus Omnitrophota bacterium]MBF0489710.1 MBOAT family protein [Candidatus Omnitrophota bacterium]